MKRTLSVAALLAVPTAAVVLATTPAVLPAATASPIPWATVCDPARDYQEDDGCWDAELHGNGVPGPLWNCETMGDQLCNHLGTGAAPGPVAAPVPVPVERGGNR